jgi:hypothetical protein
VGIIAALSALINTEKRNILIAALAVWSSTVLIRVLHILSLASTRSALLVATFSRALSSNRLAVSTPARVGPASKAGNVCSKNILIGSNH